MAEVIQQIRQKVESLIKTHETQMEVLLNEAADLEQQVSVLHAILDSNTSISLASLAQLIGSMSNEVGPKGIVTDFTEDNHYPISSKLPTTKQKAVLHSWSLRLSNTDQRWFRKDEFYEIIEVMENSMGISEESILKTLKQFRRAYWSKAKARWFARNTKELLDLILSITNAKTASGYAWLNLDQLRHLGITEFAAHKVYPSQLKVSKKGPPFDESKLIDRQK